jgi:hypothetical protein
LGAASPRSKNPSPSKSVNPAAPLLFYSQKITATTNNNKHSGKTYKDHVPNSVSDN